eukprot:15451432-Alexandrium_andersonii.AAC.1
MAAKCWPLPGEVLQAVGGHGAERLRQRTLVVVAETFDGRNPKRDQGLLGSAPPAQPVAVVHGVLRERVEAVAGGAEDDVLRNVADAA